MQPLQICIGPTIRIGRESWCLPYAGFFYCRLYIFQYMCIYLYAYYEPTFWRKTHQITCFFSAFGMNCNQDDNLFGGLYLLVLIKVTWFLQSYNDSALFAQESASILQRHVLKYLIHLVHTLRPNMDLTSQKFIFFNSLLYTY